MRRLTETTAPGVFLPDPPHDFVGRAEALEALYAPLVEKQDKALLYGEPGSGKSTLALKFAWQTQSAFDAVVFQLCGQRTVAEIAPELAAKLKLGVETKPPEEQIAAAKPWLGGRRALLVLDDIWENEVKALVPGPPVSVLCTSRRRSLPWISRTHSLEATSFSHSEAESIFRIYLGEEPPKNISTRCLSLRNAWSTCPSRSRSAPTCCGASLIPYPRRRAGCGLSACATKSMTSPLLLRRAIDARPEDQRRLLNAMAVCAIDGFWLALTVEIAGLTEMEGDDARDKLVGASLLRVLDRDRQRFQLHALLREELRNLAPLEELQAAHAAALERLFDDWEGRWRECRECLPEVIPAVQHLWEKSEKSRAMRLTNLGFATGRRVDGQAFHPGHRSQSPQHRQPCFRRPFQTLRDNGPRQDGCGSRPFPLPKGSASATRKESLSPSRRCLRAGLVEAAMRRRCHVLQKGLAAAGVSHFAPWQDPQHLTSQSFNFSTIEV
jgi:hypothetical protein